MKLTDEYVSEVTVTVPDAEDDRIALEQCGDVVYMTTNQLQQLVSHAIKSRWIDSIPM